MLSAVILLTGVVICGLIAGACIDMLVELDDVNSDR
jgi:hypothetical protein